ncbi:nicF, partial [Symbiodinium microadriaticum]
VYFEHPSDGGIFTQKIPKLRTWTKDNPLVEIDDSIAPHEGDAVLVKQYPSAFFGTSLACNLRAIGVDTCIMIGCSTSGCIRASVLDGMQQGFRCVVPRECVGDRTQSIHESNLFDINAKNGDVVPKQSVMDYMLRLEADTESSSKRRRRSEYKLESSAVEVKDQALEDSASNYKLGFGSKSAVIVIDFTKAYTTPGSSWYCPGRGYGVVDAVAESRPLV